jgi:limonene 1,2-monooxygenase
MDGGVVTQKTDWFDLNGAQLQLQPYGAAPMEMAVACARSPVGAVAAGRHGIGMLSIGGTSDDALKAHAANWGIYTDHANAAGKVADRGKWRIVTFAHVAETREQARRDVAFGLQHFADYFREVATFPIIPADVSDPLDYLIKEGIACIGTPDDCIAHFERLWQGSEGGFGAALLLAHNWADWDATRKSYELMARYVHPHFQGHANHLRQHSYNVAAGNRDTHVAAASAAVSGEIDKFHKKAG